MLTFLLGLVIGILVTVIFFIGLIYENIFKEILRNLKRENYD